MTVIIWITEGTWQATVDAARVHAPAAADLVLLHVTGDDVSEAAHGSFAGLLGRDRPGRDPAARWRPSPGWRRPRSSTTPPSGWDARRPGSSAAAGSNARSSARPTAPTC